MENINEFMKQEFDDNQNEIYMDVGHDDHM
jgi:hypothetical protein